MICPITLRMTLNALDEGCYNPGSCDPGAFGFTTTRSCDDPIFTISNLVLFYLYCFI